MAGLLFFCGLINLPIGCLAAASLGRDVRTDGTLRQVAFGPAMFVSGLLALSAGLRNWRFEDRARGLLALASLAAFGLAYARWLNPYVAVAAYGLGVYLSPPGREAFRFTYWRERDGVKELVKPSQPPPSGDGKEAS